MAVARRFRISNWLGHVENNKTKLCTTEMAEKQRTVTG